MSVSFDIAVLRIQCLKNRGGGILNEVCSKFQNLKKVIRLFQQIPFLTVWVCIL